MRVDVLHPATIEYVPRRGKAARVGLVGTRTPAELRAVSGAEAPEAGLFRPGPGNRHAGLPVVVREHGGRRWAPVADTVADRVDPMPGPVTAEAFASYLSGNLAGPLADLADAYFSATPVNGPCMIGEPGRGHAEPDLRIGRVLSDGREGASVRLGAYLESEVLLIGGVPHARFRPTLLHSSKSPLGFDVALTRHPEPTTGRRYDPGDLAHAYREWPGEAPQAGTEAAAEIVRLAGPGVGDTALLANLNALPRSIAKALDVLAGKDRAEFGTIRPRTASLVATTSGLAFRGRIGGIGVEESQAAVQAMAEAVAYLLDHDLHPEQLTAAVRAKGYLAFARPRIDGLTAPAAEDVDALAHLAP